MLPRKSFFNATKRFPPKEGEEGKSKIYFQILRGEIFMQRILFYVIVVLPFERIRIRKRIRGHFTREWIYSNKGIGARTNKNQEASDPK